MRDETFDYVVVGGGSAGSIVAGRLAQANARVLLLEAGTSDRKLAVRIPAAVQFVFQEATRTYLAEPDASRNGLREARCVGQILGGGGSINSMIFVRGHHADFDGWAQAGASGWDHNSLLPCFMRLETWERGADPFRGADGPISVGVQTNRRPACLAWIEAAAQAGYARNADYNGGGGLDGVALAQVNQRRGLRSHSSQGYLRRLAPATFLTIRTEASVHRIVVERGRAIGVEYRHRGTTKRALAREEVVLNAGAFATPKLLMLSGIGPREELERVGVEVLVHSPGVGQNLHDHVTVTQPYRSKVRAVDARHPIGFGRAVTEFVLRGRGVLTSGNVQAIAMYRTDPALEAPDAQLAFADVIPREITPEGALARPGREGFRAASMYVTPRGRGRLRLRSASPEDPPIVEHELLADAGDLRGLLAAMAESRRVMAQPAMAEFTHGPGDEVADCRTDADWERYARHHAVSSCHPVGTCRMGTGDTAVVDPELRVHGIVGLRVADSSIMPTITRGNTNAPSMVIGERAVDFLTGTSSTHPPDR